MSTRRRRHRAFIRSVVALLATGCGEKAAHTPPNAPVGPTPDSFVVSLATSRGTVDIEIVRALAPVGVDHFYQLVRTGFFDENRFYRVVPGFITQFGVNDDPTLNAHWDSLTIPDDAVRASNVRGTIAFAHNGPHTRTDQVFFNTGNNARLDTMAFAPFGHVIRGMEAIDSIYAGYREEPEYHLIATLGNKYLLRMFPKLDYIRTARVVTP